MKCAPLTPIRPDFFEGEGGTGLERKCYALMKCLSELATKLANVCCDKLLLAHLANSTIILCSLVIKFFLVWLFFAPPRLLRLGTTAPLHRRQRRRGCRGRDTPIFDLQGSSCVDDPPIFWQVFYFFPAAELLNTAIRCHFHLQCAQCTVFNS